MHSAGDDALSYVTLQMTGSESNYQGTWQVDGQDGILRSGTRLQPCPQSSTIEHSVGTAE